ncbi:MAG: hypothetical protein WCQ16_12765 [Verrucomicrobiae bacterium]
MGERDGARAGTPWIRGLVEVGAVFAGFVLAAGMAFVASWQSWRFADIAAAVLWGLLVLGVLVRGILCLWHRAWVAGILHVLAVPVCFLGGLAAIFVAGLGGGMATEWDFRPRVLPVQRDRMDEIVAAGQRMAADLSRFLSDNGSLALGSMSFTAAPPGEAKNFSLRFFKASPGYFSIDLDFAEDGNAWKRRGESASGDTETFAKIRSALQSHLPSSLPEAVRWPVDGPASARILEGAETVCAWFGAQGVLQTAGKVWQVDAVRYVRHLRQKGEDSVRIELACKDGGQRVAWAVLDWAFDGKSLRFLDATGGVNSGTDGTSSMENSAEVQTIIEEWLTTDRGIFGRQQEHGKPWRTCEAELPGGVRLIYSQQNAHPFLTEYRMRAAIRLPDGSARIFSLPMNTGGRTSVLVYTGATPEGTPALRMVSGKHCDMAFDLKTLRVMPAGEVRDADYAGAFLEVSTPLTWFPARP